jgi:hypothetical protein
VLLVLVVLMWVGAGVYYLRGRPDTNPGDSIGHFRRQLRVLERTGPTLIDPAHQLGRWRRDPIRPVAPPMTPMDRGSSLARSLASTPGLASARRRQTIKRRRDMFFGLVLGIVGSLFLGLIPGLRVMWLLAAGLTVALAVYVVLLVNLRNQAVERTMKVRFLNARQEAEPAYLLRRSATN